MIRFKSTFNWVFVLSAIFLMLFFIACGNSAEKQAMTDFITMYDNTVNEFSKADDSSKAEIKAKLDSLKTKWSNMKMEMGAEVTPQILDKLDDEYVRITKRYTSLLGKS